MHVPISLMFLLLAFSFVTYTTLRYAIPRLRMYAAVESAKGLAGTACVNEVVLAPVSLR